MTPQDEGVYEFGPFRLEVAEKLLSRNGKTVALEPTQFEVLAVLVRAAGHLVTRDHLRQAVWRDTYVDEGSLTVTISMLRRKLGDTPAQPRFIETVRKAGYRFVAPVTQPSQKADAEHGAAPSGSPPLPAIPTRAQPSQWEAGIGEPENLRTGYRAGTRWWLSFAVIAALLAIVTGWYGSRSGAIHDPAATPVPLHPFGGIQDDPSFSPDGRQVAFTWRPPDSDNDDVYVVKIGDLQATRLTSDPALDKSPAWSPDGRRIAFIRRKAPDGEILVMSPAGGPEQKVVATMGTSVAWSPDGQTLVFIDRAAEEDVHSIFLVPAAGGAKRRVTFPDVEKLLGDSSPAISPDGRTLAFVRHMTYDVADIFVQPLDEAKARRVTFDKRQIRGLAWMPGGGELIFSSNRSGGHQLWRVGVNGRTQPTLVEGLVDARSPAVSGSRLVYQAFTEDYNIRLLRRGADGAWNGSNAPVFAASIRAEQTARLSPDGRRVAFTSDRSGWFEIWVCAYPDGSDCRQLTSFRQGYVGSPSWSPDSQRLAFDARVDGNADVYVVRVDGGQPVRLTEEPSVESGPVWSGDGRWIYFRSDRGGVHQIWKMPVVGGAPNQVTKNGGYEAREAPDGKSLYYVRGRYDRELWTVPVDGGEEIKVPGLGSLTASSWAPVANGILWVDSTKSNPPATIRFYDFATRGVSTIAEVANYVIPSAVGFYARPDGTMMMWSQRDRSVQELMLVERFR